MIYLTYDLMRRATRPWAWAADRSLDVARSEANPLRETYAMRTLATLFELQSRALKTYTKPEYRVFEELGDQQVFADQRIALQRPFADLLNFNVDDGREKPKVLIVSALSGHFSTLLQGTIRAFTQDYDTYITDWKDVRQVPKSAGPFTFDGYVRHIMDFLEALGPDTHVVATCQAAPPAMIAAALLAKQNAAHRPATLTLMGGPIDTRVNPGQINKMADKLPLKLFEWNNLHTVPPGHPGSGRKVYPGFYQLAGFILLNPKPHFRQYWQFAKNSVKGEQQEALEKFRDFYDEYFAVLDMDGEFYIETLRKVFMEHHIPRGLMEFEGHLVDFEAVDDLPLLTVEGANDHLCPPGQTEAAHDVFRNIPPELRRNHIQDGVGHYGVFSGSKFDAEIYPVISEFITRHGAGAEKKASA